MPLHSASLRKRLAFHIGTLVIATLVGYALLSLLFMSHVVGLVMTAPLAAVAVWLFSARTLAPVERTVIQAERSITEASHELRTPLMALRSTGEVGLATARAPEELREVVGDMLEQTERMSGLVENMLLLARAEDGRLRLNAVPLNLRDLLEEVMDLLAVLAEEKGQRVALTGGHGAWVLADRGVLRMALVNILDNAIKYSPPGGRIDVALNTGTERVALEIADSGPGIAPEDRERVFERFFRAHQTGSNGAGHGLGLAIARWAVRAHGGDIQADSVSNNGGALFRLVLPVSSSARIFHQRD